MRGISDYYNKTASWAASGYQTESEIPALTDFVKKFPQGSRFLDMCCGCGYDSARIYGMGYEVIGIDFSEESLKITRHRNPNIIFVCENILNDYSYVGKVDGVILIAGLVHVGVSDLRQVFSRMRDVMMENGQVFLTIWEGMGKIESRSIAVIDGVTYDRNFIGHNLSSLVAASEGLFSFLREVAFEGSPWHHYIFKCV